MAQTREFRGVETTITSNAQEGISFIYRGTTVVKVKGAWITLNSNGWRTATTKTRMNQASNQFDLGYSVWQKNYEWFVSLPNGDTVEYTDGLTFKR